MKDPITDPHTPVFFSGKAGIKLHIQSAAGKNDLAVFRSSGQASMWLMILAMA